MSQATQIKKKRTYQPAWEKLKAEGFLFIKCRGDSQRVIIKAIQKEKYMDDEKFEMLSKMEVKKHKHGVEFRIVGKPTLKDF